jgi:hypothetical protein
LTPHSLGKRFLTSLPFDPALIAPFAVFRCDYHFPGDPATTPERRFVCLGHRSLKDQIFVMSLKATSKLERYRNNPKLMQGVVFYSAGTIPCFEKDTAIQTEKIWPIDYYRLKICSTAAVLGVMPKDFPEALRDAVQKSVILNRAEKQRIFDLLGPA